MKYAIISCIAHIVNFTVASSGFVLSVPAVKLARTQQINPRDPTLVLSIAQGHLSYSTLLCSLKSSKNDFKYTPTSDFYEPVKGVTLKMAFDETYSVADASELKSERFTCPKSLDLVHYLRRNSDCVLVGKGTVVRDDCTLTVRRVDLWEGKKQPVRVVIDSNLQILNSEFADSGGKYKMLQDGLATIVYHSSKNYHMQNEEHPNLTLVEIPRRKNGNISPKEIIQDLASKQIHHIMVEGGPATAINFLQEGLVDRAIIIRAPVNFIDPVPSGMTNDTLKDAGLVLLEGRQCGDDTVEYWVRVGNSWPTTNVADWPN